jgi:hypothetical protein
LSRSLLLLALLIGLSTGRRSDGQVGSVALRVTAAAIDGIVSDTSLVPLSDAVVAIAGSHIRLVTGADGRFRVSNIPLGQYILSVHRLGYQPVAASLEIGSAETLRLSFALERAVPSLDTVVSRAVAGAGKLAEFYARREHGDGQFMSEDEIEKRNGVSASDLLRTFTSVAIVNSGRRARSLRSVACDFQVFLDGVPTSPDLELLPTPKAIAAIEVYSGPATIPLQYKRPGACAVIMSWTRDGA